MLHWSDVDGRVVEGGLCRVAAESLAVGTTTDDATFRVVRVNSAVLRELARLRRGGRAVGLPFGALTMAGGCNSSET